MAEPNGTIENWTVRFDGDDEHGYFNGVLFSQGWPGGIRGFNTDYVPALSVGKVFKKGDIVVTSSDRPGLPHGAIFKLGEPRV